MQIEESKKISKSRFTLLVHKNDIETERKRQWNQYCSLLRTDAGGNVDQEKYTIDNIIKFLKNEVDEHIKMLKQDISKYDEKELEDKMLPKSFKELIRMPNKLTSSDFLFFIGSPAHCGPTRYSFVWSRRLFEKGSKVSGFKNFDNIKKIISGEPPESVTLSKGNKIITVEKLCDFLEELKHTSQEKYRFPSKYSNLDESCLGCSVATSKINRGYIYEPIAVKNNFRYYKDPDSAISISALIPCLKNNKVGQTPNKSSKVHWNSSSAVAATNKVFERYYDHFKLSRKPKNDMNDKTKTPSIKRVVVNTDNQDKRKSSDIFMSQTTPSIKTPTASGNDGKMCPKSCVKSSDLNDVSDDKTIKRTREDDLEVPSDNILEIAPVSEHSYTSDGKYLLPIDLIPRKYKNLIAKLAKYGGKGSFMVGVMEEYSRAISTVICAEHDMNIDYIIGRKENLVYVKWTGCKSLVWEHVSRVSSTNYFKFIQFMITSVNAHILVYRPSGKNIPLYSTIRRALPVENKISANSSQNRESVPNNQNNKDKIIYFRQFEKIPPYIIGDIFEYQKTALNWLHFSNNFAPPKTKLNRSEEEIINDEREETKQFIIKMYKRQKERERYMNNSILADQMGLGKTIETLLYLATMADRNSLDYSYISEDFRVRRPLFLVIVGSTTISSWISEGERFTPSLWMIPCDEIILSAINAYNQDNSEGIFDRAPMYVNTVLVTSYEFFMTNFEAFKFLRFTEVVIDEAHKLKGNGQLAHTVRELCFPEKKLITNKTRTTQLSNGSPNQDWTDETSALNEYEVGNDAKSSNKVNDGKKGRKKGDRQRNHKSYLSKRQKELETIKTIKESNKKRPHLLLLTGTPIQNNLNELYNLLLVVNGEIDETNRYFNKHICSKNISSLSKKTLHNIREILKPHLLSRRRDHVLFHTSNMTADDYHEFIVTVPPSSVQTRFYAQALRKFKGVLLTGKLENTQNLEGMLNKLHVTNISMFLRHICNHPILIVRNEETFELDSFPLEPLISYSSKLRAMDILLTELFNKSAENTQQNQKEDGMHSEMEEKQQNTKPKRIRIIIFSKFVIVLDILMKYFSLKFPYVRCGRLDGNVPHDMRSRIVESFNGEYADNLNENERLSGIGSEIGEKTPTNDISMQKPKYDTTDEEEMNTGDKNPDLDAFVLLMTTQTGGLGLNLPNTDMIILYDSDFNPHSDIQAIYRAIRVTSKRYRKYPLTVIRLVVAGTIDESIVVRGKQKKMLDNEILKTGHVEDSLDNDDGNDSSDNKSNKRGKLGMVDIMYGAKEMFEQAKVLEQKDNWDDKYGIGKVIGLGNSNNNSEMADTENINSKDQGTKDNNSSNIVVASTSRDNGNKEIINNDNFGTMDIQTNGICSKNSSQIEKEMNTEKTKAGPQDETGSLLDDGWIKIDNVSYNPKENLLSSIVEKNTLVVYVRSADDIKLLANPEITGDIKKASELLRCGKYDDSNIDKKANNFFSHFQNFAYNEIDGKENYSDVTQTATLDAADSESDDQDQNNVPDEKDGKDDDEAMNTCVTPQKEDSNEATKATNVTEPCSLDSNNSINSLISRGLAGDCTEKEIKAISIEYWKNVFAGELEFKDEQENAKGHIFDPKTEKRRSLRIAEKKLKESLRESNVENGEENGDLTSLEGYQEERGDKVSSSDSYSNINDPDYVCSVEKDSDNNDTYRINTNELKDSFYKDPGAPHKNYQVIDTIRRIKEFGEHEHMGPNIKDDITRKHNTNMKENEQRTIINAREGEEEEVRSEILRLAKSLGANNDEVKFVAPINHKKLNEQNLPLAKRDPIVFLDTIGGLKKDELECGKIAIQLFQPNNDFVLPNQNNTGSSGVSISSPTSESIKQKFGENWKSVLANGFSSLTKIQYIKNITKKLELFNCLIDITFPNSVIKMCNDLGISPLTLRYYITVGTNANTMPRFSQVMEFYISKLIKSHLFSIDFFENIEKHQYVSTEQKGRYNMNRSEHVMKAFIDAMICGYLLLDDYELWGYGLHNTNYYSLTFPELGDRIDMKLATTFTLMDYTPVSEEVQSRYVKKQKANLARLITLNGENDKPTSDSKAPIPSPLRNAGENNKKTPVSPYSLGTNTPTQNANHASQVEEVQTAKIHAKFEIDLGTNSQYGDFKGKLMSIWPKHLAWISIALKALLLVRVSDPEYIISHELSSYIVDTSVRQTLSQGLNTIYRLLHEGKTSIAPALCPVLIDYRYNNIEETKKKVAFWSRLIVGRNEKIYTSQGARDCFDKLGWDQNMIMALTKSLKPSERQELRKYPSSAALLDEYDKGVSIFEDVTIAVSAIRYGLTPLAIDVSSYDISLWPNGLEYPPELIRWRARAIAGLLSCCESVFGRAAGV